MPRPRRRLSRTRRPLVALIALLLALGTGYTVRALDSHHPAPGIATVALSSLPAEAAQTVQLIAAGGPYPYPRNDGAVFHNNQHLLPREPDGYYREYTVPTPGSPDRGARRLIRGSDGTLYYTGDHYEHFVRVEVNR